MNEHIVEELQTTLDRLRGGEDWWHPEYSIPYAGRYCLYTAMPGGCCEATLNALGFSHPWEVWQWNDKPGRTWEEVESLLTNAINKYKNAEEVLL